MPNWQALDVDIESPAQEAVEYALMEAGALGTETNTNQDGLLRIVAYFESIPDRERIRNELVDALRIYSLPSSSVRDINVREVVDRDWLEEWKKSWQPVQVGRFIIAPPWAKVDQAVNQLVIRIEPGMAFGTGTHETTRLCLAAIEKYDEGGSFLDVGTGTGILAIAAAKLFPSSTIEACDTDADAVAIATENAKANDVGESINFRVGSVDDSSASADVVIANLTADVILPMLATLVRLTCRRLILSGILDTQINLIRSGLLALGLNNFEITQDGEWVCFVV